MKKKGNIIYQFAENIISGSGGLHDFEKYEWAVPNVDRDEATAIWTIQCLANPKCEGSQQIIDAILERRKEMAGTK